MLNSQDTGELFMLLNGEEGTILDEVISKFNSTFSDVRVKFYAISAVDLLLSISRNEPSPFPPAQRLMAFAILHRGNAYENAFSNPLTSLLVDAACDEKAEKYERAFVLGLLGISIPPVNCTELMQQSANDYVRIMKEKFDGVSPFPPREELVEKYVSKTYKPFSSVFRQASVSNVIPDPDVPKGCNSSSEEFDIKDEEKKVEKLGYGDRAKAARGGMKNLSTEGLRPQWIRPFPPRLPGMENELLWLYPDMDHKLELVWDYEMCAHARASKGSVVREKEEQPFGKSEQEKSEDLITQNHKSANMENPETQVGGFGLVFESHNEDHECEDQNGVVSTKTSVSCNESSHLVVNGSKSQEEITDAHNEPDSVENNTSIEPDSKLDTVVCSEKEPGFRSGDKQDEPEASSGNGKLVHLPSPTVNTKPDHGKSHTSFSVTYKKYLLESFNINREAASKITWGSAKVKFGTAEVEDIGDVSDCNPVISHGNLTLTENKHTEICKNGSVSMASSGTDEVCGEELSIKPATIPFHYLVRVPRFEDESLKERIKLQEIQLDDWTQQRDVIPLLIQETRKAIDESHGVNYKIAMNQVNRAQKLVRSKRVELDSLQLTIDKVKSAASVQDIDQRICNMEYMIQHESMPLKEEKQLIHELKQKKQLRKQLSSNIGSHDEIKESREQLKKLEKSMKSLKKELKILKGNAEKAEAVLAEEKRKCDVEYRKVEELQARYRVANDSRQEAYNQLKSLRKELKEKNKHFYKYKDDATTANNYARSKDIDTLHSQCKNQVEKFMELWNNNDEFRKEYVTFNAKSTVRRFGTLDGRRLGPNEECRPPIISSYVDQKVHKLVATPSKIDLVSKSPVLEQQREIKLENGISEEKTNKKLTKSKGKASAKDKEAAEPSSTTVSRKKVPVKVQVEVEPSKSKEEIELKRKAEEMRREEEAKLKEKLQLEKDKAKEARERKKRKQEQDKGRAILRARMESEQKEKEREERLKKEEERLKKEEEKDALLGVRAEKSCVIITGIISAMMGIIVLWKTYLN